MIYELPNTEIQITVSKKRIRSFRLRVDRSGNVLCSVPWLASKSKIEEFIDSKSKWIQKSVEKVKSSILNSENLSEKPIDFSLAQERFRATLEKQYRLFAESELAEKMPDFSSITLKCRKLKSMWGSCNRRTNTVTLNYDLMRFPQICTDYVVLHELTHFLYIYHDKNFYKIVERFMPEYKSVVKMMR